MIARRDPAVKEYAMQARLAGHLDPAFLDQFTLERTQKGLTGLDAAAGQMPPGHIAVLDQKHAILPVEDDRAHAERHAPGKSPIDMKRAPEHGLKPQPQSLGVHRARFRPVIVLWKHIS